MKLSLVAKLLGVVMVGILILGQIATSQDSIPDAKIVNIDTTVFKRFVVEQLGDVSCTFTVEIDPARVDDPLVRQETSCNNLLQFQSNSDIEVTITKNDASPDVTTPGELAILDALGVKIDRDTVPSAGNGFFGTGCTFYDTDNNETDLANGLDTVLTAELDDIWYDAQIDGDNVAGDGNFFNSQTVILNHPHGTDVAAYDCRFKLEFYLSTDDFQLLPGGIFSYTMVFTSSAATGFENV